MVKLIRSMHDAATSSQKTVAPSGPTAAAHPNTSHIPAWQMPLPKNAEAQPNHAQTFEQPVHKIKAKFSSNPPLELSNQTISDHAFSSQAISGHATSNHAPDLDLIDPKPETAAPRFKVELEPELRDPTRFGIAMSAINVALYSIMSLAQWMGWGGFYAARGVPGRLFSDALAVMTINFMFGVLAIAGVFILKPMDFRPRVRYPLIAVVTLVAAAPRVLAMMAIYTTPSGPTFLLAELISGWVASTIAVTAGVLTAGLVGRARREHQRYQQEAEKGQRASDDLHTEEMRVRRMVADQLHGRLQYRLVTIAAGLDADATRLGRSGGHDECAATLTDFANQLDQVREQEVRALSHAVYPAGIELGAVSAIRAMVHRLPPQINASLAICPTLTAVLDNDYLIIPLTERLIAVFTIEEAITNALKHGNATRLTIELEMNLNPDLPGQVVLAGRLDDNGIGLKGKNGGAAASGNLAASGNMLTSGTMLQQSHTGLARHTERLTNRGGHLTLSDKPDGGVRMEFSLPFTPLVPIAELESLANWQKGNQVCSSV